VEPTERQVNVHWARIIVAGVLIVVIAAIAIDNSDDTRIGYVFGDTSAPLFAVLIITAVVGALIGWLLLHRPHRHHD
jgi:uncharacterized integral membrane protein